jgi:hypothetical protein
MNVKPKLQCTRDYSLFAEHPTNRPASIKPELVASMRKYGFLWTEPMTVSALPNGKLQIKKGHHRFRTAMQLGLAVWYIVESVDVPICEIETPGQTWSTMDFACAYAKQGNLHYKRLVDYTREVGLPLTMSAAVLRGYTGPGELTSELRSGRYKIGDTTHADALADVIHRIRDYIPFAAIGAFSSALASAMRVPEFDASLFVVKCELHPKMMSRRARRPEYLQEIEALYNYGVKATSRLALQIRVREILATRNAANVKKQAKVARIAAEKAAAKKLEPARKASQTAKAMLKSATFTAS